MRDLCVWEGARRAMGRGKGRPLFSLSPSRHSPRAAVSPSPQAYGQEVLTVKATRKRTLGRREFKKLILMLGIDPLHKWRLHLNNNTYTSLASHS